MLKKFKFINLLPALAAAAAIAIIACGSGEIKNLDIDEVNLSRENLGRLIDHMNGGSSPSDGSSNSGGSSSSNSSTTGSSSSSAGGVGGGTADEAAYCPGASKIVPECASANTEGTVCFKKSGNVAGWNASNANGRTCKVNGGNEISGNFDNQPAVNTINGYVYINCSAGDYSWFATACW